MPHPADPELQAMMDDLRSRLMTAAEYHEMHDHAGESCPTERANMLAYLAHALGLEPGDLRFLRRRLRELDVAGRLRGADPG